MYYFEQLRSYGLLGIRIKDRVIENIWNKVRNTIFDKLTSIFNAVLCLLGNLPASEILVPKFRNLLAIPSS